MDFKALFAPNIIATYWVENPKEREPYFGESKFPNNKQNGIELSWIKGSKKAPVQLSLSAFDAQAIKLSRGGFTVSTTTMPFFKNILSVDEKLRQQLLLLLDSNNEAARNTILKKIYDDQSALIEDAALTREAMRMQILTTGVLSLNDNGQSYTYDYGVPLEHKVTPKVKWDDPDADIITDINDWLNLIQDETGIRPSEMLTESGVIAALANNKSIRNAIYVLANGTVRPSSQKIKEYILQETGLTIYEYNKGYKDTANKFVKFVPKGTVVLMPSSALGSTWFGTTPEEASFAAGQTYNLAIVDTGVALSSNVSFDPVELDTKVSQICLPSFELADQVIMASVLTA